MTTTLVGAAMLLALMAMDRTTLVRLRHLDGQMAGLRHQAQAAQSAHHHSVESLSRRMRDIEAATSRAEREARIVSLQLADLCRVLTPVADTEGRNE